MNIEVQMKDEYGETEVRTSGDADTRLTDVVGEVLRFMAERGLTKFTVVKE